VVAAEGSRSHGVAPDVVPRCGMRRSAHEDIVAPLSRQRQAMHTPGLTIDEQHNIDTGSWFSKLSPTLKAAILSRAAVRRLRDGDTLASRGSAAEEWCGVARGAVRISSVSLSGKQITLTYAEPGTWFGDIALFDGLPRTHDADAHGDDHAAGGAQARFQELLRSTWSCTTRCCG
jgi:CRP/FNR family cyclic AMP-dependent transcriptional regulator